MTGRTRFWPMSERLELAERMAEAAGQWLGSLTDEQRATAQGGVPGDDDTDARRRRWFYTPTDHGGLTLHDQRPAQQRHAMRLVASGQSEAGFVTVATTMGLENVLDRHEGFVTMFDRERGRDPGLYYLRVFGDPGSEAPWAWRFGGHHVSLNNLVIDGELVATTPCFLGADPASSPLLGGAVNRPLARVEDLARDLVRSLAPDLAHRALLRPHAPSDLVTANRTVVSEGDRVISLAGIWRDPRFSDDVEQDKLQRLSDAIDDAAGYSDEDHRALAYTHTPRVLPARTSTTDNARRCARCSGPTSGACRTPSRRWTGMRRTPRSTRCTSPGPDRSNPVRRTTTGCRVPACSSSGTTPSAGPTTRTRSGATRPPTSGSTCWPAITGSTTAAPRDRPPCPRTGVGRLIGPKPGPGATNARWCVPRVAGVAETRGE